MMGNKAETEIERSDRPTKAWSERCGSCVYRGAQPPPQRIAKENMEKLAKVLNVPVEEVRRAVEEEKTT